MQIDSTPTKQSSQFTLEGLVRQPSIKKIQQDSSAELPSSSHQLMHTAKETENAPQQIPWPEILEKKKKVEALLDSWGRQLLFVDEQMTPKQKIVRARALPVRASRAVSLARSLSQSQPLP